jgi:hypothetical protein
MDLMMVEHKFEDLRSSVQWPGVGTVRIYKHSQI